MDKPIFEVNRRKKEVYFGDLEDLMRVKNNYQGFGRSPSELLHRVFVPGNYVVSMIDLKERNRISMIIIHQENLDPDLISKKLRERRDDDMEISATRYENNEITASDWLIGRYSWPDYLCNMNMDVYYRLFSGENDDDDDHYTTDQLLDKNSFDVKKTKWPFNLFHAVYRAQVRIGDLDEANSLKFSKLFYFVNDLVWLPDYGKARALHIRAAATGHGIYSFNIGGKNLGFAFDPDNFLGNGKKNGVLLQNEEGKCFSLAIYNSVDGQRLPFRKEDGQRIFTYSMEQFFYESQYRSFYKSGLCQDNRYYGASLNADGFDFFHLPKDIFVKILSSFPWRRRLIYRRINTVWAEAVDLSIVVESKILDCTQKHRLMGWENFDRLLPRMAKVVESIILYETDDEALDIEQLNSIPSFPLLREINFGCFDVDLKTFFSILDKSPNLEILTALISEKLSTFEHSTIVKRAKFEDHDQLSNIYGLEKLSIDLFSTGDADLIAITNYFPKLSSFALTGHNYLTNSCLSSFVESYGDNLTHLELDGVDLLDNCGVLTFGTRPNLTYLSFRHSKFVDNDFLASLTIDCVNLDTLILDGATTLTSDGLANLTRLKKLKRLSISSTNNELSVGVSTIAKEGRLEQLIARNIIVNAAALKSCIRYCHQFKLLDRIDETKVGLSESDHWSRYIPGDDDVDGPGDEHHLGRRMAKWYQKYGNGSRLIVRTTRHDGWHELVLPGIQQQIKRSGQGCFTVDYRAEKAGFLDDPFDWRKYVKGANNWSTWREYCFDGDGTYSGSSSDYDGESDYEGESDY